MLKSILVKFKDSSLNYTTSVNPKCDNETLKQGFVNQWFNMGCYPAENMQKCIDIEIFTEEEPKKLNYLDTLNKDDYKRLYLDYVKRFLTVEGFADYNKIDIEEAYIIIEYGRQLNESVKG